MIREIEKRENTGFEVQWYGDDGDNSCVTHCDTAEELAQALARAMWGSIVGFRNNPSVWHNGKRWCLNEYTPVNEDGT